MYCSPAGLAGAMGVSSRQGGVASVFLRVAVFLAAYALCQAANPIDIPIIKNALDVHTARFAKIPDLRGASARILSLVPLGKYLYVCTNRRIYKVDKKGNPTLFFDVDAAIKSATGRELNLENAAHGGLRSVAFHPKFSSNKLFYTSVMEDRPKNPSQHTYLSDSDDPIDADSVLIEWKLKKNKPDPKSYREVFRVGMPVFDHTIRQIVFRKNLLYIAHGDGSVQSATAGGGMLNNALGKILRINPLRKGSKPYQIPKSNPFRGNPNMLDEVYALGFRNPHHICFGKDGTLYNADTGRANIEEVNLVKRGGNYGWPDREGTFVMTGGGLITGIKPLPRDDAKNKFEYPSAQYGHEGPVGAGFIGQAIAGACPVENNSPMAGNYYYADFPKSGNLYFSSIKSLKKARTMGSPSQLTQARTQQARIFFDHDDDPSTPPRQFDSLGDVMRSESKFQNQDRVDVRFGRGSKGELYWSSKRSGRVYIFLSSLPGGPGGKP